MNVDVSKITVSTSPFHLKLPGNPVDYKKMTFVVKTVGKF